MFEKEFQNIHDLAKKHDIKHYDVYLSKSKSFSVKVFHQDIDTFSYSDSLGLGIRIIFNDVTGYSYTEKLDKESLSAALLRAKNNAKAVDYKEKVVLVNYPAIDKDLDIYNKDLVGIPLEDKINKAKEIEKVALDSDERIINVPHALIGDNEDFVKIANSSGLNTEYSSNACYGFSFCLAKEGDETKSGYFEIISRDFSDIIPQKISNGASQKALELLSAHEIQSGNYPILFNNEMAATLLGTFWSIFSAKTVQEGQSLLKGQLGNTIAHPIVNIIDDALLNNGYNTRPFDDEGYPSQKTSLISDGILQSYLHNTMTALKDGTISTGNASRSYKTSINISPSNLYIKPGLSSKSELYSVFPKCIEIVQLSGMHSGCNTISGDFSMGAQGFYCEEGQRKYPIHNFTVSGNFLQLLKHIVGLADDLKFKLSATGSPSILVENLSISG
ncbi:MAG: TldD/PmbA family protein [Candidatus Cloacimonetes bacterium]|nr:TldD/PmbA family protein [Candidatus Cloacimonadota bacterium]